MHELSIALSIIDVATEEAERQGAKHIAAVHIKLGPLSGVEKEALCSAYGLARELSALAHADLIVEETPLVVYCPQCETDRELQCVELCCPVCATATPNVVCGRELEVVALEIES